MNIILPSENLHTKDFRIENGVLYLRYGQSFQNVIYSLTYFMKGRRFCYYCKKKIPRNEMTMVHMYPRSTGGPTIPQNLIPSCKECNYQKADMTYEQYHTYLSLPSLAEKKAYAAKINIFKEGLKMIGMFEIPNTWITPVRVSDIHTQIDFACISETKYEKARAYYIQHRHLQHPIILDRNLFWLDGFYVLFVAKSCGVPVIPAIILENVEIHTANK